MRVTNTHVYFWGNTIFSNWDTCSFHDPINDVDFKNSEQAFMFFKALFFNDKESAYSIALEADPKKVKELGRGIKNYNDIAWGAVRLGYMVYVNYLKFSQNSVARDVLLETKDKILVEASPIDKIWGVGLRESDDAILDEKNWQGQNLLGKALMEVRKIIK